MIEKIQKSLDKKGVESSHYRHIIQVYLLELEMAVFCKRGFERYIPQNQIVFEISMQ